MPTTSANFRTPVRDWRLWWTTTAASAVLCGLIAGPSGFAKEKKEPPNRVRTDAPTPSPAEFEKIEPLVPKNSLTLEEARRLEAKKLFVIATMQLDRKDVVNAVRSLEKALSLDPKSHPVLRQLAMLSFQLERTSDGVAYAKRALDISPDDAELLFAYGRSLADEGNESAAVEALQRAAKLPDVRKKDAALYILIRDQLAELYERTKNPAGVAQTLIEVLQVLDDPNRQDVDEAALRQIERNRIRYYEKIGRAFKDSKQFDKAVEVLAKGRDVDGRGVRLALPLAEAYVEAGQNDKALAEVQTYLRSQAQDRNAFELYEKILAKLGREKDLLPSLEKLIEGDAHNPVLRLFYGQKLMDKKEYQKAKEQFEKVPNRAEVLPLLAKLLRAMNDPAELVEAINRDTARAAREEQEAVAHLIRLLSQDKEFLAKVAEAAKKAAANDKKPISRFNVFYVIALAASEAKDVDLAKDFFLRCVKERPDNPKLEGDLINFLWQNERYADVVEYCRTAVQKRPNEFDMHEYLARALEMSGKTDDAVKTMQQLIDRVAERDTMVNAYLVLLWIHQHSKQYDKAIADGNRILSEFRDSPRIPYTRYLLSNVYTLKGDSKEAERLLQQLVDADPDSLPPGIVAAANNDLGYLWADEGRNLPRAQEMIKRAITIQPNNAAYLDSMGWVLFKVGKFGDAVTYLKKAVEVEESADAVIWDHLGDAYQQIDKMTEARKAWEKSIELYKKDPREKDGEKLKQVQQKLTLLEAKGSPPPKRATKDGP